MNYLTSITFLGIGDVGSELSNLVMLEKLDLSGNYIDVLCQDDFLYMENLMVSF